MNNPSKVASNWFGDKERGLATAIGSMALPVGMIISFILPNAFLSSNVTDPEEGKHSFVLFLLV